MMSGEDHCDQELADEVRPGEGGGGGREGVGGGAAHLTENLTTLTWQVGNKHIYISKYLYIYIYTTNKSMGKYI